MALSDKDTIDPDDRHEAESTLYDFTTVTMTDLLDKNHAPAVLDFVSIDVGQRVQRRLLPRAAMAPHKACALRLDTHPLSRKWSAAWQPIGWEKPARPPYEKWCCLSTQVEGAEVLVLQGFDFKKYCIQFMTIEHNGYEPLRSDIRENMEAAGHKYAGRDGFDDYYSRKCA